MSTVRRRAAKIRCAVFDIDGVMTDGLLYLGPDGAEWKAVSVRDGLGLKLLLKAGIEVAVISGRPSLAMEQRLRGLGVKHVFLNAEDKLPAWEALQSRLGLGDAQCSMMGDDTPDLPLLQRAGLALTVADAHPSVIRAAHWTSRNGGGRGAVREACDLILASRAPKGARQRGG